MVLANGQWVPHASSKPIFWFSNWLGYCLADRLDILIREKWHYCEMISDCYSEESGWQVPSLIAIDS